MNNRDKTIEELTFSRIKNLEPDSPSAGFTQKVMQSILAENRPVYSPIRRNYFWLIPSILAALIIGWYLENTFQWTGYLVRLWIAVFDFLQPIINIFLSILDNLKNLHIQPMVLISFIAMFSLLFIEEFVRWTKRLA